MTVQLFWALGVVVAFTGFLLVAALVFESRLGRRGIDWVDRRRKAAARWAEILSNRSH